MTPGVFDDVQEDMWMERVRRWLRQRDPLIPLLGPVFLIFFPSKTLAVCLGCDTFASIFPLHVRQFAYRFCFPPLQMENALFRVKAQASVKGSSEVLEGVSDPIKVVSKPDQIRKKRREANQEPLDVPTQKKRARSEDLIEALAEIRQTQVRSLELLKRLSKSNPTAANSIKSPRNFKHSSNSHSVDDDFDGDAEYEDEHSFSATATPSTPTPSDPRTTFIQQFSRLVGAFRSASAETVDASEVSDMLATAVSSASADHGSDAVNSFISSMAPQMRAMMMASSEVPSHNCMCQSLFNEFLV
jgi:hypothetical protein